MESFMTDDKALIDRVQFSEADDVRQQFNEMEKHFIDISNWITANKERNEYNLILFNILSTSANYLHIAADNVKGQLSVLALATRGLYELNLRLRHICVSEEKCRLWMSEAVIDRIQILEGILKLSTRGNMESSRAKIRADVDRLNALRKRHKLPDVKAPRSAGSIAKDVGLEQEHKALYKLFSKLVHPSSYLVNSTGAASYDDFMEILVLHTQLYAWDTYSRICDFVQVPDTVRNAFQKSNRDETNESK